jgi:hypothetical protein
VAVIRNGTRILNPAVEILHVLLFTAANTEHVFTFVAVFVASGNSQSFPVDVTWVHYIPTAEPAFP